MVSVIIPNYNHSFFLKKRIESVLNQTYKDFELIILDDKSTDNSREIIEKYKNHPQISHIIYNEVNTGSTFQQWNKGISLARGEYIWIAESDDYVDDTFLEKLMTGMLSVPNCVLAYSGLYKMSADECNFQEWAYTYPDRLDLPFLQNNFSISGFEYIKSYLTVENTIPNASAVIFQKQAFYAVGQTDEDIKYCSDWLLWLKILTQGNVFHLKDQLNYFRIHQTSVIGRIWSEKKEIFLKKYTIIMWFRFLSFIRNNKERNLALFRAVKNTIAYDSMIEAEFLLKHRKVFSAISYVFKVFRYSDDFFLLFKTAKKKYFK